MQNHLDHKQHLPECVQNLIRPVIETLAKQVELNINEARPNKDFWDNFDSEAFLKDSLEKHNLT